MAIIHCGFVPHQDIFYKLRLISIAENPNGFIRNAIIAKTDKRNSRKQYQNLKNISINSFTNHPKINAYFWIENDSNLQKASTSI